MCFLFAGSALTLFIFQSIKGNIVEFNIVGNILGAHIALCLSATVGQRGLRTSVKSRNKRNDSDVLSDFVD